MTDIPVTPRDTTGQPVRGSTTGDDANVVDLLRDLTRQGSHLAQQQVALVQAEMREGINDIKAAIGAMAGAAVVGIAGLGVTLMGLGWLLGQALDNDALGILIVGVATLILAYILYAGGKKKLDASNLKPERSIRTAEHSAEAATGKLHTTENTHGR